MSSTQNSSLIEDEKNSKSRETPDWESLRKLSLEPGGFGAKRVSLWKCLLHAEPTSTAPQHLNASADSGENENQTPHPDERQIRLDTERSFVLYPVGVTKDRDKIQSELYELLVGLFRKRPKLSYFQGYHDIVTVLFLTLPPELQLVCAEKISLHRVRDSMGSSLEPVLGLLRILKNLLRAADPDYATILESNSPLPYHALSGLLTLFAHDMPTLPLIQHVFDYLLCRPPICVVYLSAAIILSRKADAERLEQEGEEGMLHSLLSSLPEITDGEGTPSAGGIGVGGEEKALSLDIKTEMEAENSVKGEISEGESTLPELDSTAATNSDSTPALTPPALHDTLKEEPVETFLDVGVEGSGDEAFRNGDVQLPKVELPEDDVIKEEPADDAIPKVPAHQDMDVSDVRIPSLRGDLTPDKGEISDLPPESSKHPSRAAVTLTSLLTKADELFKQYPPTSGSVGTTSIMGTQSVIFTWSEDPSKLPADDVAEAMANNLPLIVHPFIESDPSDEEADNDRTMNKKEKKRNSGKRKSRKLIKARRIWGVHMHRRTVITSAVIVLGVAMAVYGMQAKSRGADSRMLRGEREWRRILGFVGGLLGASERIFNKF